MNNEIMNVKEGYLVDGKDFLHPTELFARDAAEYIRTNFCELDQRIGKNNRGENVDDNATPDLIRTLSIYYKGIDARTLMFLTSDVRQLLHPHGMDFSKIDFKATF